MNAFSRLLGFDKILTGLEKIMVSQEQVLQILSRLSQTYEILLGEIDQVKAKLKAEYPEADLSEVFAKIDRINETISGIIPDDVADELPETSDETLSSVNNPREPRMEENGVQSVTGGDDPINVE